MIPTASNHRIVFCSASEKVLGKIFIYYRSKIATKRCKQCSLEATYVWAKFLKDKILDLFSCKVFIHTCAAMHVQKKFTRLMKRLLGFEVGVFKKSIHTQRDKVSMTPEYRLSALCTDFV